MLNNADNCLLKICSSHITTKENLDSTWKHSELIIFSISMIKKNILKRLNSPISNYLIIQRGALTKSTNKTKHLIWLTIKSENYFRNNDLINTKWFTWNRNLQYKLQKMSHKLYSNLNCMNIKRTSLQNNAFSHL